MAVRIKGKGWGASGGKYKTAGKGGRGIRKPTTVDGIKFPSKLEAKVYARLKLRERAGEISGLELQPVFSFVMEVFRGQGCVVEKIVQVISYKSDFAYNEKGNSRRVVHEAKGYETDVWKRNRRWFEKLYPEYELRVTFK